MDDAGSLAFQFPGFRIGREERSVSARGVLREKKE